MPIEVSIPKEITEYKEKIAFGMSMRQIGTTVGALAVGVPIFYLIYKISGDTNTAGTVVMFLVAPIFAFGFVTIRGYAVDKYLKILYQHRFLPQKRQYANRNLVLAYYTDTEEKEQTNGIFWKEGKRKSGAAESNLTAIPYGRKVRKAIKNDAKAEIKRAKAAARQGKKDARRDKAV